jgi:hypothetical protein
MFPKYGKQTAVVLHYCLIFRNLPWFGKHANYKKEIAFWDGDSIESTPPISIRSVELLIAVNVGENVCNKYYHLR